MEEETEELVLVEDLGEDIVAEEEKEEKINIFDLFNDISTHGKFLDTYFEEHKKLPNEFSSFMAVKFFSNFLDTIFLANEMNKNYNLPDEMQWRFFKNAVTKKKRFSKWFKENHDYEPLIMLANYFHCSVKEIQKNLSAFKKDELEELLKDLKKHQ